jgi:hypothetical protein
MAMPVGDGEPEATAGSFRDAGSGVGVGDVLARPAGADQVDGRHRRPVQGGDVADVGHIWPRARQDGGGVAAGLRCPGQPRAGHGHNGEAQAAVPAAHAAGGQRRGRRRA